MKVSTQNGKIFTLARENEDDQRLIDAMHHTLMAHVATYTGVPTADGKGFEINSLNIAVDHHSEAALRAKAGRQALSAIGQLFSLGLGEAAQHGHIGALTAYPQAQEQFTTGLVQLQVMLDTLRDVVVQAESVFKKVQCTHCVSPVVEAVIVKE